MSFNALKMDDQDKYASVSACSTVNKLRSILLYMSEMPVLKLPSVTQHIVHKQDLSRLIESNTSSVKSHHVDI